MARQTFAVLDLNGNVITSVRGDLNDAVGEASSISGSPQAVVVDGTATAEPDLRANEALVQLGRDAYAGMPAKAMRRSGLQPLPWSAVEAYRTIDEAYEEVAPIFKSIYKERKSGERIYMGVYDDAKSLAGALFGQNAKVSKRDPLARLDHVPGFKGQKGAIRLQSLSLLPAQTAWGITEGLQEPDASLPNTCVGSSPECRAGCLVYSGQNENDKYNAMVKGARMKALYEHPAAFMRLLTWEMRRRTDAGRKHGIADFFRLNTYSDIPWELFCPEMFEAMPDVGFFDYTKVAGRNTTPNYDLTFSFSGGNESACLHELKHGWFLGRRTGRRVAVVFLTQPEKQGRIGDLPLKKKQPKMFRPLPAWFWGYPVVNGDYSDARMADPPNAVTTTPCVVGLHYKIPLNLKERVEKGLASLGKFVIKAPDAGDVRQAGMQVFREYRKNANAVLPTVVVQAHEVDGWLVMAGTPMNEGGITGEEAG